MAGHLLGMWIAFALAAGVITFFIGTVSETLRKRQKEVLGLQQQVARQERLASLVTLAAGAAHEMSTPLAHDCGRGPRDRARGRRWRLRAVRRCPLDPRAGRALPRHPGEDVGAWWRTAGRSSSASIHRPGTVGRSRGCVCPKAQRGRLIVDAPASAAQSRTAGRRDRSSALRAGQECLDASPEGGAVTVAASTDDNDVRFLISDHGEGMDAATLARVAEPFFTSKPPGKGMGLGRLSGPSVCDAAGRFIELRLGARPVAPQPGSNLPLHVR